MAEVDTAQARSSLPVQEFVIKIASRCNLDCDYCYEYRHGDESWRNTKKLIAPRVYEEIARKIATHVRRYQLREVGISLHGGEPLLVGAERLAEIATFLDETINGAGARLSLGLQTNAVLITDEIASVIEENNILVGVSLDGGRTANDRHRLDHRGKSSYDRALAGIETLRRIAPRQLSGLLAVIDISNDPIETFDQLASLGIANIDLLLPHHNWDRRPPGHEGNHAPYGEWLDAIWAAWISGRHSHLRIRFLDNIVARLVGHPGLYEQMSDSPIQLMTINTDGDFEGVDTLKSTGSGIQKTGLNILRHEIDAVQSHPLYVFRQHWKQSISPLCEACQIRSVCTGGYLPHRYSTERGFDNPSVYCKDILHIVSSIESSLKQLVRDPP